VELLGGTKITERLSDLKHEVQGLSIEWVSLEPSSFLVNKTIGEGRVRTESGASIVAVLRGTESIPGPGPELTLLSGDTLLVIGSQDGVIKARRIITG
jgi:TrkA domain protein